MIPEWNERPIVIANLLNPAFCGEVLRVMIKAYAGKSNASVPYELVFLVLPLVLQKKSREKLPKNIDTNLYEWLEKNTMIKIHLTNQIKNLIPYTREALLFLIYHNALKVSDNGRLEYISYRKNKLHYLNIDEIEDIYLKAQFLGRWLSKIGDSRAVYLSIGIIP